MKADGREFVGMIQRLAANASDDVILQIMMMNFSSCGVGMVTTNAKLISGGALDTIKAKAKGGQEAMR